MLERLADDVPNSNLDNANLPLENDAVDQDMRRLLDDFLFYGITCVFLVLSYIIAMSVSDLGVILGVVGATGSTMVSYILPGKCTCCVGSIHCFISRRLQYYCILHLPHIIGAVYMKLHPEPHTLRHLACLQLSIGVLIVPTALYFVLFKGSGA
jgi:Amino acid permeases